MAQVTIEITHACNMGHCGKRMTMPQHRAELLIKRGVAKLVEVEGKRIASPPRNKAVAVGE